MFITELWATKKEKMPTIEIAIYDSEEFEIDPSEYRMAIQIDNELVSHRGLFIDELREKIGIMLHLGNSDLKNSDGGFWASDLIDWKSTENDEIKIPQVDLNDPTGNWGRNQQYVFQFNSEFRTEIDKLLKISVSKSKISKIGFLTDYQFGPEVGKKRIIYSIKEFWETHDSGKLIFNTIYEMYKE